MITAYHSMTDYAAAELLAVNPLHLWCKPLRGFGGVTARLGRVRNLRHALQGLPSISYYRG
jgi:hypothetical protein